MLDMLYRFKRKIFGLTSEEYIQKLREKGVSIGKGCRIYDTKNVVIDTGRPWLLTIGDYVKITGGLLF